MKAIVLLNRTAGTLAGLRDELGEAPLAQILAAAGIEADIHFVENDRLRAAANKAAASDVDVVIAGGGDGTLSTVAGALVGTQMPMGVLPLGTLNHFAKDLGIPLDVNEAARVIAARNIGQIDVGQVNERVFLNNSSLGVYPRMVLEREVQRSRHGLGKWAAMALAIFKVFRRFPLLHVRLAAGDQSSMRKTPLVFVGNNCYQLDLLNVGTRACLSRGELSLYVANTHTRWGMFKLTIRAMLGRLEQTRDFESICLSEVWIQTRRHQLHVAIDGEVVKLRPPLHYRVWPKALNVCLPDSEQNRPLQAAAATSQNSPLAITGH